MWFFRNSVALLLANFSLLLYSSSAVRYVNEVDLNEINPAEYVCEKSDPESYTLACFNKSLLEPYYIPVALNSQYRSLSPVQQWINQSLLERLRDPKGAKYLTLTCEEMFTTQNILYYFVLYKKLNYPSAAEKLSSRLAVEQLRRPMRPIFSASMIIFPLSRDSSKALAYLFGDWKALHNSRAVVPNWGILYASHCEVFQNAVKGVGSRNDVSANPQSSLKKRAKLAPIKEFDLQVGTEGLRSLKSLPKGSKKTTEAKKSIYKLNVTCAEEDEGNTVDALAAHGVEILHRMNNISIDEKLQPYINVPIEDALLIESLNRALEEEIEQSVKENTIHELIFPDSPFWSHWGKSVSFKIGTNKFSKNFYDVVTGGMRLDTDIPFKTRNKDGLKEKLRDIISLFRPFQYEGFFYSYEKATWYRVEPTRLEAIKRKFRKSALVQDRALLLPYTKEDEEGVGGLYAEDAYNKRIVEAWNSTVRPHGSRAILVDRLEIFLKGSYDKFEFADIVLYDERGNWDIIHVKRRTSKDMDYLRNQIERTVEYLTTELKNDKGKGLFFESFLKALYETHGVSSHKKKRTKLFKRASESSNTDSQDWSGHVSRILEKRPDDGEGTNELKELLNDKDLDVSFFENYQQEYFKLIDALRDCNKVKRLTNIHVTDTFVAARQAINLNESLFKQSESSHGRRKITLVMAVIDNRDVAAEISGMADGASRDTPLFHLQDLWGLDRTCQRVETLGFSFALAVVNNRAPSENQDIFGDLREPESVEPSQEMLEHPSAKKRQSAVSKRTSQVKKRRKALVDDSESEKVDSSDDGASADDESFNGANEDLSHGGVASGNKGTAKTVTSTSSSDMLLDEDDCKVYDHQYSPIDIARLLRIYLAQDAHEEYVSFCLNDGEAGEHDDSSAVVHKSGTRYLLPPVYSRDDPEGACVQVLRNFLIKVHGAEVTEIIIPFNCMAIKSSRQLGHWYTIHMRFIPQAAQGENEDQPKKQLVNVLYYDSTRGKVHRQLLKVLGFLRTEGYVHYNATSERSARKQSDFVSCGPITVENIKELFTGRDLSHINVSKQQGFNYKKVHRAELLKRDWEFDFIDRQN